MTPQPEPTPTPGPGLFLGIEHVGVTVPDIETATKFFQAAFDAEVVYEGLGYGGPPVEGPQLEHLLNVPPGTKIRGQRLLRIGNGPSIELFEMRHAPQRPPLELDDFGWNHVCFYVDDIDQAAQRFVAAGGTLLTPPHGIGGLEGGPGRPRNRGVYGRPPWGGLIELLTYPDGIGYPNPNLTRWTPQE